MTAAVHTNCEVARSGNQTRDEFSCFFVGITPGFSIPKHAASTDGRSCWRLYCELGSVADAPAPAPNPEGAPLEQTYCAGWPFVPPSGNPGGVIPPCPDQYGSFDQ